MTGPSPNYKPGESGLAWVQATIGGLWRVEPTNGAMTRAHTGSTLDAFYAVCDRLEPTER